jgi:hypothetical protein
VYQVVGQFEMADSALPWMARPVMAEWTCTATRAVFRGACRAQVPNPFVAKCFGFPSSAWARQIYLLSERPLERASDGAAGPGDRSGRLYRTASG